MLIDLNQTSTFRQDYRDAWQKVFDQIYEFFPKEIIYHPKFQVDIYRQGFYNFKFGATAGPCIEIENLFHEICHAVQFGVENPERFLAGTFDFRSPDFIEIGGQWIRGDFTTCQPSMRELEVFAMQDLLLVDTKPFEVYDAIMKYLPDAFNFEYEYDTIALREELFNKMKSKWTRERIWSDFKKILDLFPEPNHALQ